MKPLIVKLILLNCVFARKAESIFQHAINAICTYPTHVLLFFPYTYRSINWYYVSWIFLLY